MNAPASPIMAALLSDTNVSAPFRNALAGIVASTRRSPALDRAEAQILALGPVIRARRWQAIKLGAEVILNDLQAGNPCTFERALHAGMERPEAYRQALLVLRWRRIRGTKAVPPTWRSAAALKSYQRMGMVL